jgi:hypothetical protein
VKEHILKEAISLVLLIRIRPEIIREVQSLAFKFEVAASSLIRKNQPLANSTDGSY